MGLCPAAIGDSERPDEGGMGLTISVMSTASSMKRSTPSSMKRLSGMVSAGGRDYSGLPNERSVSG